MNLETHLQFGDNKEELYGKDYLVVEFHSHFSRGYNSTRPETRPDCTSLEITLVAPDKNDLELQEWYFGKTLKSGRVLFEVMDLDVQGDCSSFRSLFFYDAQCFSIGEKYDIDGECLRLIRLAIHCRRCEMAGVPFGSEDESAE